jgi:trehalose 6-phosphate phosphatase
MSIVSVTGAALADSTPSDLFFDQFCRSGPRVLLLDYDGTIAPFTANRHRALPYSTVPDLLDCIMSTCRTRVALITGRAAREIPPLLGINPHPEIWGTYGMERLRADGRYSVAPLTHEEECSLEEADAKLEREGVGELVELKPGALAVHWRGLKASQAEEVKAVAYRVLAVFANSNLLLSEFDGGIELRLRTRGKGDVVRAVVSELGRDVPVAYLGDDSTDEDAFRMLNGRGLTVLVRPTYRFTAAQIWIRPPAELVQFLTTWVQACGGDM